LNMVRLSGGEILVECLVREGVRYVFGIPGDRSLPFLDAIHRIGRRKGLEFITTRHEQAAAHMADAYYRVTGKPAVCYGTVGPGAADLIPGVYAAYADSIPVIVITSQNQLTRIYPDHGSMQSLDQHSLFKPVTKWSAVVNHVSRIPELVQRAFRTALTGRPGPVHLDIPSDVIAHEIDVDPSRSFPEPRSYRPVVRPRADPRSVREAVKMLAGARLPLIHAGSGALRSDASEELMRLAETLKAPVITSLSARGAVPEDWELCLIPGSPGAFVAMGMADVVLHIGGKLGDMDLWGRSPPWGEVGVQKWIQVDIDPEMIGLNRPVDLALVGDAKAVLEQMLEELRGVEVKEERDVGELRRLCEEWERGFLEKALSSSNPIHPLRVVYEARSFFPRDAISVVDGGNTAVWAHYLNRIYYPRTFLWAADSGHLGAGLPYAIAAKLASPDRSVYLLTGDGAFMLNVQELETASRLGTEFVAIVFNDSQWGMIKGAQKLFYRSRYVGVDFGDVRHDLLAEAMGCYGIRVERVEELRGALREAASCGRPAVVDVKVDREANLTPPDLETLAAIWLEGCEVPVREELEEISA
jgi:acetolactate synthase-1/2/3 large subunit